jgi:hypothetical protein
MISFHGINLKAILLGCFAALVLVFALRFAVLEIQSLFLPGWLESQLKLGYSIEEIQIKSGDFNNHFIWQLLGWVAIFIGFLGCGFLTAKFSKKLQSINSLLAGLIASLVCIPSFLGVLVASLSSLIGASLKRRTTKP